MKHYEKEDFLHSKFLPKENPFLILSKEQIEELQKNPYFDKYADKIAKLQKYAVFVIIIHW